MITLDSRAFGARYETCIQAGCVAVIAIDADFGSALDTSKDATLTITTEMGRAVALKLSLDGYADAAKAFAAEGRRR